MKEETFRTIVCSMLAEQLLDPWSCHVLLDREQTREIALAAFARILRYNNAPVTLDDSRSCSTTRSHAPDYDYLSYFQILNARIRMMR